jgi:hypothetical protein
MYLVNQVKSSFTSSFPSELYAPCSLLYALSYGCNLTEVLLKRT